jgi:energy-converting hydrogenase Eha subunit B
VTRSTSDGGGSEGVAAAWAQGAVSDGDPKAGLAELLALRGIEEMSTVGMASAVDGSHTGRTFRISELRAAPDRVPFADADGGVSDHGPRAFGALTLLQLALVAWVGSRLCPRRGEGQLVAALSRAVTVALQQAPRGLVSGLVACLDMASRALGALVQNRADSGRGDIASEASRRHCSAVPYQHHCEQQQQRQRTHGRTTAHAFHYSQQQQKRPAGAPYVDARLLGELG